MSNDTEYDSILQRLFADLTHYTSGADFGRPTLHVRFTIDAAEWRALRAKGQLGFLYGVDLGNFLSRTGVKTTYAVPVVDDHSRASKGRKTILVRYELSRDGAK